MIAKPYRRCRNFEGSRVAREEERTCGLEIHSTRTGSRYQSDAFLVQG